MHSKFLAIHDVAMNLFIEKGCKDVIMEFGRYPHRNKALNRESTPEEVEFIKKHKGF